MTKPLTLSQFIDALEKCDKDNQVRFDFGGFAPTTFASWRGDYSQLALGYDRLYPLPATGELIAKGRAAIGQTMMGYKGGEYRMSEDTYLWADNWGESSCTAIVGVLNIGYMTIIQTQYIDYPPL